MTKDKVCMRRRECFKEMIRTDCERDMSVSTVELEVRRKRTRYMGKEDATNEKGRRAMIHLKNEKAGSIDGVVVRW